MVAVTGASGVGKSTLLHILGGLDRPTRGTVTLGGEPVHLQSEESLARFRNKSVGFVFQSHYLLDDFDALENVMIPMLLAGTARSEAALRAEHLLQEVSLADRQTHRPRQLSGGEQQRVAVARALANGPEIVLADEPSGNLDTATGRALHELLFRLNSETSATFVIATHNEELAGRCSRRCRIQDGKLHEE
jgi:lipoprotein-releasing system ATP-binding protein